MNNEHEKEVPDEAPDWPQWLDQALSAGETSDQFRLDCQAAAQAGLSMVKLRKQKEVSEFRPIPFDRYVDGLAKAASVALSGLFSYYGVADSDLRSNMESAVRFAHDLGLPQREAILSLKYCIAEEVGAVPVGAPVLARGPMPPRKGGLDEWEHELEYAVRRLPMPERRRFDQITQLVREEYEQ